MGSAAASGGYYIAAPATKIFAEEETITGSIGVFGLAMNGQEFDDKYGLSFHIITQSDRARYFNFGQESSEEDRAIIGKSIDQVYDTFLARVGAGRAKTKEQVHTLAQGRVYTGKEALELGLVDFLGGKKEAFTMAKKLANLNPEKLYPLKQYKAKPESIFDCLGDKDRMVECLQELDTRIGQKLTLDTGIPQEIIDPAKRLKTLIEDDNVQMYWPGQLMLNGSKGVVR